MVAIFLGLLCCILSYEAQIRHDFAATTGWFRAELYGPAITLHLIVLGHQQRHCCKKCTHTSTKIRENSEKYS